MVEPTASFSLLKSTHAATPPFPRTALSRSGSYFYLSCKRMEKSFRQPRCFPHRSGCSWRKATCGCRVEALPDAGLPELGSESKFLQAPADVKSHASPSRGGEQPPESASQRCGDEHFGEEPSRGGDNPTGIACAGHGAAVDQPPPSMQRLFSTHREILTHFFIYWVNFSVC